MATMQALFAQNPGSIRDLYLQDPRYQLAQQAIQSGTSTAPAQGGWGEGLARIFQGALGGKMAGEAKKSIDAQEKSKAQSLADALSLGRDLPAQTENYGDGTTINWDARKGSQQAMVDALSTNPQTATIGMGVQGALMDSQIENQADLKKLQFANDLKASEPITPYQQKELAQSQQKIDAGANGISYTMPDGTQIQIGGSGGSAKMSESQQAASSRATLMASGLKQMDDVLLSPEIGGFKNAVADQIADMGPVGQYSADKMRSEQQQKFTVGRDSALEGVSAAITGAGVSSKQDTHYRNMQPTGNETVPVRLEKMIAANQFLLNQTNIAGPVADQLKEHTLQLIQKYEGLSKQNPVSGTQGSIQILTPPPMAGTQDNTPTTPQSQLLPPPNLGRVTALPQGAKQIGTMSGKPVFKTPDGQTFMGE